MRVLFLIGLNMDIANIVNLNTCKLLDPNLLKHIVCSRNVFVLEPLFEICESAPVLLI